MKTHEGYIPLKQKNMKIQRDIDINFLKFFQKNFQINF